MRDVGQVRDGSAPQTNVVHVDGARAVLSTMLKNGSASTLAIVDGVKARLPILKEILPEDFKITPMNDQSLFVKARSAGSSRKASSPRP
jgi:multidrug efflux pump subunit AcrB